MVDLPMLTSSIPTHRRPMLPRSLSVCLRSIVTWVLVHHHRLVHSFHPCVPSSIFVPSIFVPFASSLSTSAPPSYPYHPPSVSPTHVPPRFSVLHPPSRIERTKVTRHSCLTNGFEIFSPYNERNSDGVYTFIVNIDLIIFPTI
jgi:hypothetical protein